MNRFTDRQPVWQYRRFLHILGTTILAAVIVACSNSGQSGANPAESTAHETEVSQPVDPGIGTLLPAPSTLKKYLPEPRDASYVEADLFRSGDAYSASLPNNKVTATAPLVEFDPAWNGPPDTTTELAYCMYAFDIQDYDRNAGVSYIWDTPPVDIDNAWIGMANWDDNNWDWYSCNTTGLTSFPSIDPYFAFGGGMLVCVVIMGTDDCSLSQVRIGTQIPVADLSYSPVIGIAPLTITFDGSLSQDIDGTIVRYEWDLDNNGTYETDQGSDPVVSHEFTTGGEYTVGLRVTDNNNAQDETGKTIQVAGTMRHTWGLYAYDYALSGTVDVEGNMYLVGYTPNGTVLSSGLLLKINRLGEQAWAKMIDGLLDEGLTDVIPDNNGYVYTCGTTTSEGAGMRDGLVQKWTEDGDLVWQRAWGGTSDDNFHSIALSSGNIYLAGDSKSFTAGGTDAIFVCVSAEGDLIWEKRFGSTGEDTARSIAYYKLMVSDPVLLVTGWYDNGPTNQIDILYLSITEEGSFYTKKVYSSSGNQRGQAILAPPPLGGQTMIAGYHETGSGWNALVLPAAGTWAIASQSEQRSHAKAIIRIGSDYLVGGQSYNDANSVNEMWLLGIDSAGVEQSYMARDVDPYADIVYALANYADGIAIMGSSASAPMGWAPKSPTITDFLGSWSDLMFILPVDIETSAFQQINLNAGDVTGVMDTGGGYLDMFYEIQAL